MFEIRYLRVTDFFLLLKYVKVLKYGFIIQNILYICRANKADH